MFISEPTVWTTGVFLIGFWGLAYAIVCGFEAYSKMRAKPLKPPEYPCDAMVTYDGKGTVIHARRTYVGRHKSEAL